MMRSWFNLRPDFNGGELMKRTGVILVIALLMVGSGCAGMKETGTDAGERTGVQTWSENCGHCHNVRAAESYSPAQWDVVMLHMRVRANLTAQEHAAILEFLQSASRGSAKARAEK
jgi:hypothetical protein